MGGKLATQLFGVNELALRALPLGAGIVALFLFAHVARRLLPGWPGVLAAASACVAPPLVFYSAELKPYVVDLAIGLLLVHATMTWIEQPTARLARLALGSERSRFGRPLRQRSCSRPRQG